MEEHRPQLTPSNGHLGLDFPTPCYEIDYTEMVMSEATFIGEGARGEVYLVKWNGTEVAAKKIRSLIASNQTAKQNIARELAFWQKLHHPNIVQFHGVLKHSELFIYLSEHLQNGSLYDMLRKKGRFDPPTAVAYALDIARGMNYLHSHEPCAIIHRDLTPRHVLQDKAGRLKITGFGLSKFTQGKETQAYKLTGGTGSYRYMAPEVYRRESYGKSVDVFSFAMIVYEMFEDGPTNRAEDPLKSADRQAYEEWRPPLSSCVYPEPIKKLLRDCWHKNLDCRHIFDEIILQLELIQENLQQLREPVVACYSCSIL